MRKILLLILVCLSVEGWSQKLGKVAGIVKDAFTNETIPSAVIVWGEKMDQGMIANVDGTFELEIPQGGQRILFKCVGYDDQTVEVLVGSKKTDIEVLMVLQNRKELVIVTDLVVGRKVPVAYSNIDMKRIDEELSGREMATLANTTPGAYATRSGGGDGDARVTIRGFSGNNVAVMLDGVPVNDMENGTVYWSNWFGLDLVTQTTQIQRGLGASKLVIPAVGGTMNIITRGIESKRRIQVKQEYAFGAFARTSFGMNTGKLKNGWAFSFAASIKDGKGWVDGTDTRGAFGFFKVEKKTGNHLMSFYAMAAPQRHGQRSRTDAVAMYSHSLAEEVGAPTTFYQSSIKPNEQIFEGGVNYNPDLGYLSRYTYSNGVKSDVDISRPFNARQNFYFKPQMSLKDVWTINPHSFLSTVAYFSMGSGGGTNWNDRPTPSDYKVDGTVNVQAFYDRNTGASPPLFVGPDYNINPLVSATERYNVSKYIKANMNDHRWVGALSTYNNEINENWTFSGGLDLRYYKGIHYGKIYDLLGADYIVNSQYINYNNPNLVLREGDITDSHFESRINWGGVFGQFEYSNKRFVSFISASAAYTGYNRVDYFAPKRINIDGVYYNTGYVMPPPPASNVISLVSDTTYVNGQAIYSGMPGSQYQNTGWYYRPTFTTKAGVKYTLTEQLSVFVNGGYLDKAPIFNQVYNYSNDRFNTVYNEKILSFENGWSYKSKKFTSNVNVYYTQWKNKPFTNGLSVPNPMDPSTNISVNIQGMGATHKGIEWDAAIKITDRITLEALASFADWRWMTGDTIFLFDNANRPIYFADTTKGQYFVTYDAYGVHVSDAAQTQLGLMLRYEWENGAYIKGRYTWFDRYYADFNPFTLTGENSRRDSWRIPSYGTMELHAGYSITDSWKTRWDFRASVFNVFNSLFITDAKTNDANALYTDKSTQNYFTSSSAGVFVGQPRWFSLSVAASF